VLFDLHTSFDPTSGIDPPGGHPHLPWQLTVHFQDYPKDVLTRRDSPDSLRDVWLNNLKEVCPPLFVIDWRPRRSNTAQPKKSFPSQIHKFNPSTNPSQPSTQQPSTPSTQPSPALRGTSPSACFSPRHTPRSHPFYPPSFRPRKDRLSGRPCTPSYHPSFRVDRRVYLHGPCPMALRSR
jgi:Autophagy protein Apg5